MEKRKKILLLLVMLLIIVSANAQGIFSQKAGQIKNLIKQVALLQVYIGYVEKGYTIAKQGLGAIGDIKRGDLQLHLDYFNGLKNVNPAVKRYTRIAEIIALQVNIVKQHQHSIKSLKANPLFSGEEFVYIEKVYSSLLKQCGDIIDALIELTTTSIYAMKDDERIERIDRLAADMQDKHVFAQAFVKELQLLGLQKWREQQEVNTGRLLNNIK